MKKKIVFAIIILIVAILIGVGITTHNHNREEEPIKEEVIEVNTPEEEITGLTNVDEEGLEVEGFQEENTELYGAVQNENEVNTEELVSASSQNVYYSQVDSRWKNHPYTSIGKASQTIGTSGCGPTSAAMVVSTIKGVVYPDTMGDLYVSHGYRSANNGTYLAAFKWTANYYGIEYSQTTNLDTAVDYLRQGYKIVASCGNGLFTTGGHLIAIMGIDGDTLIIHDPYLYNGKFDSYGRSGKVTVSGTTVYCSISNYRAYANCSNYFMYKGDGSQPTPQPTPTPSTSVTKYVNAKIGLNVRYGPGTNYQIVGVKSYNQAVTVYSDSNGWSQIGDNQYVASQYLSDSQSSSSSTTQTGTVSVRTSLNVRSGPGTNYRIVGSKHNGNRVTIYESRNGFYRIGTNQWVSASYVRIGGSSSNSSIVGTKAKLKYNTVLYSNSNLTGYRYNYLPNTTVKILSRNGNVDYVQVVQTGRKAYLKNTNAYK